MDETSFLWPLASSHAASFNLVKVGDGSIVADCVEAAFERTARRRGLLGRDGLAPGAALIIAPCSAVHTFFMRFAIDVVFAARDGRVVKIVPAIPPWRLAGALSAFATIECAAGAAERARLSAGDVLMLAPK